MSVELSYDPTKSGTRWYAAAGKSLHIEVDEHGAVRISIEAMEGLLNLCGFKRVDSKP